MLGRVELILDGPVCVYWWVGGPSVVPGSELFL